MRIERFDVAADVAAVLACHQIHVAAVQADQSRWPAMSPRVFEGWLRCGWGDDPLQNWLARDGSGEVSGYCQLTLPERENRHTASVQVVVHPAWRRAGTGTALLACAADRARVAGRTLLTGHTDEPFAGQAGAGQAGPGQASAGQAFARALGARHRHSGVYRVLRPASVPGERRAALRARADAATTGYELLTWTGGTPAGLMPAVIALFDAEADAPHAPGEEPAYWDESRVRAEEEQAAGMGYRSYTVAARPRAGGDAVALTQILVDPAQCDRAVQQLTAVVRPHRGHRLGLLVKLAMLDLLAEREPQVAEILTHNADGNDHMAAINADLGYEVLQLNLDWELETARVLTLADPAAGSQS